MRSSELFKAPDHGWRDGLNDRSDGSLMAAYLYPGDAPTSAVEPAPLRAFGHYRDRPTSWSARLFGMAGTTMVLGLVLLAAMLTWQAVYRPPEPTSQPLVVEMRPLAASPEPVRDVAPGPRQVERQVTKPEPVVEARPISVIQLPAPLPAAPAPAQRPVIADPRPVVPQTTAPKSIAAPTTDRVAAPANPNWEGLVLAHLERFRRYPPRARAARQQGTVYVRFRMNRSGKVLSMAVIRKSGAFELDQAALQTLDRAQPLPAIPEDRPEVVELTIPVEFYLR